MVAQRATNRDRQGALAARSTVPGLTRPYGRASSARFQLRKRAKAVPRISPVNTGFQFEQSRDLLICGDCPVEHQSLLDQYKLFSRFGISIDVFLSLPRMSAITIVSTNADSVFGQTSKKAISPIARTPKLDVLNFIEVLL